MIVWHLQMKASAVFLTIDIVQRINIVQLMRYDRKKISIRSFLYNSSIGNSKKEG